MFKTLPCQVYVSNYKCITNMIYVLAYSVSFICITFKEMTITCISGALFTSKRRTGKCMLAIITKTLLIENGSNFIKLQVSRDFVRLIYVS